MPDPVVVADIHSAIHNRCGVPLCFTCSNDIGGHTAFGGNCDYFVTYLLATNDDKKIFVFILKETVHLPNM